MISRRDLLRMALAAAVGSRLTACSGEQGRDTLSPRSSLRELLEAQARLVFETNRVDAEIGLFHLPSAETYRSFFAWDSGWNVIALSLLDPELAYQELKTVFQVQCEDGHVPHEVRVPGLGETDPLRILTLLAVRRQYDRLGRSRFVDPPSFLIAAELLFRRTGDPRVLELLPAMQRCVDYLLGPRDLFGDGLVAIIHPWESGTDSAPVFDGPMGIDIRNPLVILDYLVKYPQLLNFCADLGWDTAAIADANRFVFEDTGMNGVTAAGLMSMAFLYGAAGQPAPSDRCRRRASDMVRAMEAVMWDDQDGFFYPRYDRVHPRQSRRRCLSGVAPLLTGLVEEEKALRLIEGALLSGDHFAGAWLVPFNSIAEIEDRIPGEDMLLWRGHCIWASMNWIAARAAAAYGRSDLARRITRATAEMLAAEGFREYYDSRTGRGMGATGFTWPALVLDMIERYGL